MTDDGPSGRCAELGEARGKQDDRTTDAERCRVCQLGGPADLGVRRELAPVLVDVGADIGGNAATADLPQPVRAHE